MPFVKPVSKRFCELQVVIVSASSRRRFVDILEVAQQTLLVEFSEDMIGQRKQAVILLLNVIPEQVDVGLRVTAELQCEAVVPA